MYSWLTNHALEIIAAAIVALSSGAIGFNKRLWRQVKEQRAENAKLRRELARVRKEHSLVLEFNFKDRWTIRELAKMVRECRLKMCEPEGDILLEVYDKAEAELNARRLSASLHTTSSPQLREFLSDE